MESILLKKLSECPEVLKSLYAFSIKKVGNPRYCFTMSHAVNSMNIFVEFFNEIYNIDILFISGKKIVARKGSIDIITVNENIPFETLFMMLVVLLINYCEKPF